jgi:hypothetical protein
MTTSNNEMGNSIGAILLGVIIIVGGFWLLWRLVGNPLEEFALILRAQKAPGLVVNSWEDVEEGDRGESIWSHGVEYSFRTPDGHKFTDGGGGSGRLRDDRNPPYPVQVEYLPDKPTVSRISGDGCQSVTELILRKILLGGVLSIVIAVGGVRLIRSGVRVARENHTLRPKSAMLWVGSGVLNILQVILLWSLVGVLIWGGVKGYRWGVECGLWGSGLG